MTQPDASVYSAGGNNPVDNPSGYEQLRAQIARQYQIVTEVLSISDLKIRFTRVDDPDQILEQTEFCEKAPDDQQVQWQPYWAEAWAAAEIVAEKLAAEVTPAMRVLDLGCGLGLTGAVAAARGATVWMADFAPPALLFAELNSWPWRQKVEIRRVDWRKDQWDGQKFDLIVGSEVIYDRVDWPYLDRFWQAHLAYGGQVLLSEGGRLTGDEFPEWITNHRWKLTSETFRPTTTAPHPLVSPNPR